MQVVYKIFVISRIWTKHLNVVTANEIDRYEIRSYSQYIGTGETERMRENRNEHEHRETAYQYIEPFRALNENIRSGKQKQTV